MFFVAAEFDKDGSTVSAVTTATHASTAERRWEPDTWKDLLAEVGEHKIVTWAGGKWLEQVLPGHGLKQIDLFGLFVGQHRHPVAILKFLCVEPDLSPVLQIRRLAMCAAEDGRLYWRQNNGKARVWYTEKFDIALGEVVESRAQKWQTSPLKVERPRPTTSPADGKAITSGPA